MRPPTLSEVNAEIGRRDFASFINTTAPDLDRTVFHTALDTALTEWVEHGGFLVIVAPPRHGKSERVSRRLPPYIFARDPTAEIIGGSYASRLANKMSRDVRRNISSPEYQAMYPNTRIGYGENRADEWQTTAGGGYRAAGLAGGVSGFGCNWLIIDDPFKNREQAESPAYRNKVWDEYTSTFRTRLEPDRRGKFGVLITLTRWHVDDLAGRVTDRAEHDPNADQFRVIRFPVLAEPDAPDRHPEDNRAQGEPLWPKKYPLPEIQALRANGERDFVSLYQGKPVADTGDLFKGCWFRFWHDPCPAVYAPAPHVAIGAEGEDVECGQAPYPEREFVGTALSIDATFKANPGSDYVAIGVWKRTADNRHFLVELVNKRLTYTETKAALRRLIDAYNPGRILIEDAANGPAVVNEFQLEYGQERIEPRPTKGGKVSRANSVTSFFERGQVYIPHPSQAPWVHDYLAQMSRFPGVPNDDMVDQTTHYLDWVTERGGASSWLDAFAR